MSSTDGTCLEPSLRGPSERARESAPKRRRLDRSSWTLFSGVALKGACFGHGASFCAPPVFTEIQPLYYGRGINVGHSPSSMPFFVQRPGTHGFNEYPVLTGLFMWATGLRVEAVRWIGALDCAPCDCFGLATTWLLWRHGRKLSDPQPADILDPCSPRLRELGDLLPVPVAAQDSRRWSAEGRRPERLVRAQSAVAFKLSPVPWSIDPSPSDQLTRRDCLGSRPRRRRRRWDIRCDQILPIVLINLCRLLIDIELLRRPCAGRRAERSCSRPPPAHIFHNQVPLNEASPVAAWIMIPRSWLEICCLERADTW